MPAMKELVKGADRYRHFINGQWVDSTVKEWIEVENPATGAIIASVPNGSAEDADRAVVAAHAAQPGWEAMPPATRGQLLKDLARLILENRERLARRSSSPSRASRCRRRAARSRARRSI